jgi:hypothetical protein
MKKIICLTLVVSVVFGFFGAPSPTAGQGLIPDDDTLEGRLLVIWVDDPEQMDISLPPILYLVQGDSTAARLVFDLAGGLALEDLLALDGKNVQIQGVWVISPEEDVQGVFQLRTIELLQFQISATTANNGVIGNQRWLSLLCKFADNPDEPHTLDFYADLYGDSYPRLNHYWRELSYDKINLDGYMTYGWYPMPKARADYLLQDGYNLNLYEIGQDCAKAADPYVYFPDFAGVNFVFNSFIYGAFGGRTVINVDEIEILTPATWFYSGSTIGLIAHEMGHAFGLPHSSGSYGWVYDNPWDVMSQYGGAGHVIVNPYGFPAPHTIAYHKLRLGWIYPEQVYTAMPGSQITLHLERLALPQTEDYLIVIIPKARSQRYFYTLETRFRVGYDQQVPGNAIIIHDVDNERYSSMAHLLDIDGNGNNGDDGAMWTEGEIFTDEDYGIIVSIDARTDSGFMVTIRVEDLPLYDCSQQNDISLKECQALVKIYEVTGGDQWMYKWDFTASSPCHWSGVYCNDGKVKYLWLGWNNLTGSIPDEIAGLDFLEGLYLPGNNLSGSIPETITQLSYLMNLELNGNRLSGSIPSNLPALSKLTTLNLSQNELTGSIPVGLGKIHKLAYINLSNNQLSGSIPSNLGNLEELYQLSLQNNQLSGKIPAELGGLMRLGELYLGDNQLIGSIPGELGGLEYLYVLALENNRLSGEIPPELSELPNLFQLNLSNNELEGGIPADFWKLCNLYELRLDRNRLSGSIPSQLSHMCRLGTFDVSFNRLTGELSPEFAYSPVWFRPTLGYNGLQVKNPGLRALLDQRSPGWEETQTLPPDGLDASASSWDQVEVSWSPVLYTADGGHYEVGCAVQPGGPYQSCGVTGDKHASGISLQGLAPGQTQYLAVRSFTPAHGEQKNDLWSEYSAEVAVTVPGHPGTLLFFPLFISGDEKDLACSSQYCTNRR